MDNQKLALREFILTLMYSVQKQGYIEDTFFSYLEYYNPLLLNKIYPLYLAEGDFCLALKEGGKFTENVYDEHLFSQLAFCKEFNLDYYMILEDTLFDVESI